MTRDMVRQLPAGHALIIRGGYAPVIARLGAAWKDPGYRRARRAGTAIAPLTPVAEQAVPPAQPAQDKPDRQLRVVPDIDAEAAGGEDDPRAFPWS
jgi:hypothetical protein